MKSKHDNPSVKTSEKPNLFSYDNYRRYLKDLYAHLKAAKSHFSFRYFSKAAGFRSPNFLKLVIDGKRNLTGDSVERFAKALKLNKREAEFFRNLVALNQAATVAERNHFAEQVFRSGAYRKLNPLKREQHDYYATWYCVAIRELARLKDFQEDPKWIAKTLRPRITPAEAEKAVAELQKLGMLKRDESGKLIQNEPTISTGDEVASASVAQFLKLMTVMGAESIDLFAAAKRDVSSVTLSLSDESFARAKDMVRQFRKELLALDAKDQNATNVYQVNFQVFPLTETTAEQGDETTTNKETT